MLRNVLDGYLSGLTRERDFDLPLLALLAGMGFHDIHFTHGAGEFGKDFIAKRAEENGIVQYSFQSKCGDIGQKEWRDDIMGQMLEAVITGLSHPQFDANLPHQSILVTTGRLAPNAAIAVQDFNRTLEATYRKLPIHAWERPQLIDFLARFGPEGAYRANASGYLNHGQFYTLYGATLQGKYSDRKLEAHSRQWLNEPAGLQQRMLVAVVEAETISKQCQLNGAFYESAFTTIAVLRAILHALF